MNDSEPIVRFTTSRFGEIEVSESKLVNVPEGIIGFPDYKRYAIIDPSGGDVFFLWLHAVDDPDLAFIIADPAVIKPGYAVERGESDLVRLGIDENSEFAVFVILTVPTENPDSITVNLLAPLIYLKSQNMMYQVVLEKGDWSIRHSLQVGGEQGQQEEVAETNEPGEVQ